MTGRKEKTMELTIKTYKGNATVFGDDIWHDVDYDSDTLQMYGDDTIFANEAEALEEYKSELTEELKEVFPDAENIDDIVDTIMIHADGIINSMW